jgi:hypothetical protein
MKKYMEKYTFRIQRDKILGNIESIKKPYLCKKYKCTLNHSEGIFYSLKYDELF